MVPATEPRHNPVLRAWVPLPCLACVSWPCCMAYARSRLQQYMALWALLHDTCVLSHIARMCPIACSHMSCPTTCHKNALGCYVPHSAETEGGELGPSQSSVGTRSVFLGATAFAHQMFWGFPPMWSLAQAGLGPGSCPESLFLDLALLGCPFNVLHCWELPMPHFVEVAGANKSPVRVSAPPTPSLIVL